MLGVGWPIGVKDTEGQTRLLSQLAGLAQTGLGVGMQQAPRILIDLLACQVVWTCVYQVDLDSQCPGINFDEGVVIQFKTPTQALNFSLPCTNQTDQTVFVAHGSWPGAHQDCPQCFLLPQKQSG